MSFKVNLDLEHFWSINDEGELVLELAPKNRPDDVKAEFTFSRKLMLDALADDAKEKFEDPSVNIDEWFDLIKWLRGTAEALEGSMKGYFS